MTTEPPPRPDPRPRARRYARAAERKPEVAPWPVMLLLWLVLTPTVWIFNQIDRIVKR